MNTFDKCGAVAARSLALVEPFLEQRGNRWVTTDKGRLGEFLQRTVGDLILNDQRGRVWSVEMKAEAKFTGNLFLEIWSNFNFSNLESYRGFGPRPGWLLTMNADLLFYHFLDCDKLFIMSLPALQRWAFCSPSKNWTQPDGSGEQRQLSGRVYDFRQIKQSAHQQKNVTVGALVPIAVLGQEMKISQHSVRQTRMDLPDEVA